jgi:hypothetical protein
MRATSDVVPGKGSRGKRGGSVAESGAVRRIERGNEVHEARERRQAAEPAATAALDAEVERRTENVDARRICLEERDRRFGDDERNVALEPVAQALSLVRDRIAEGLQVDEHVVAAHLDGKSAEVVGPLVERPAGAEVEASVVPMACEDPVCHRAAMQGEAHVRTAVVDRMDLVTLGEQANGVPPDTDHELARSTQLV